MTAHQSCGHARALLRPQDLGIFSDLHILTVKSVEGAAFCREGEPDRSSRSTNRKRSSFYLLYLLVETMIRRDETGLLSVVSSQSR